MTSRIRDDKRTLGLAGRSRFFGGPISRKLVAKIVIVTLVGMLTIVTTGVPSLLLLAGASTFAFIANKSAIALSGPASWAAGIVIEAALLAGESGVLALEAPHTHVQYVYVLVLVAPLLAALALWVWLVQSGHLRRQSMQNRSSGEPLIALTVIVLIEAMFEVIKLRGHDFGLSWAMNGDARNHVVIMRTILSAGGITIKELRGYPALVNALGAILDGASGRTNLRNGVLMTRDVQAMAAVFVMSSIAVALLLIAAVSETVQRVPRQDQRPQRYLAIPLLACGSLAIGPFVLGLTLGYGFLSAIGAMAFAIASMVLGMRIIRLYSDMTVALLTLSVFLVVTSWTLLVVIPASALLVACGIALNRLRRARQAGIDERSMALTGATLTVSLLCLCGVVGALFENRANLLSALDNHGGLADPNPRLYVWLGIATLLVTILAPGRQQRNIRVAALLAYLCAGAVILWVHLRDPISGSWSYYAAKFLWLATCCFLWVPFVLLTDLARKVDDWYKKSKVRVLTLTLISVTASTAFLAGLSNQTAFSLPFTAAATGSVVPSPKEVALVIRQANVGGPFMVRDYYRRYDDVLGNFWSALTWDYKENGTLRSWPTSLSGLQYLSYIEGGSFSSLCDATANHQLRLVTRSPTLLHNVQSRCPGLRREIRN